MFSARLLAFYPFRNTLTNITAYSQISQSAPCTRIPDKIDTVEGWRGHGSERKQSQKHVNRINTEIEIEK